MSDKARERPNMSSVEFVNEAKSMADFILHRVHRGPGDTVDAAMHRAERLYGVPAQWLHRLRYREIRDIPISAFIAILNAYQAASAAADRAYEEERQRHEANSALVRLADFVAGAKDARPMNGK